MALALLMAMPALVLAQQQPQNTLTITVKGVSFKMIRVQGGTFTMGCTSEQGSDFGDCFDNATPAHGVMLSTYYIGETEVTQELWKAVMGSNPSEFKGDKRPVEHVSWEDCQTFIHKLNELTGKYFRLPSEAEWEFAARGGTKSAGYKYSGSNDIGAVAWYSDNSEIQDKSSPNYGTHVVKTKKPNELGIYDMSGNVREWCLDWYGEYHSFAHGVYNNPAGPSSGSGRVVRGGSWTSVNWHCSFSYRINQRPDLWVDDLGFRLVIRQE